MTTTEPYVSIDVGSEEQHLAKQWGDMVRSTMPVDPKPVYLYLTEVSNWPTRVLIDIQKAVPCIMANATPPNDKKLYLIFPGNQEEAKRAFEKVVTTFADAGHLSKVAITNMTDVAFDRLSQGDKLSCAVTFRYENSSIDQETILHKVVTP